MRSLSLALAALALSGCAQKMPSLTAPAAASRSGALESEPAPLTFTVKRYPGGEPYSIASDRG
ncbi:MAG TPA: TlpA family protein disulfide reductase, partial [Myxococcota bacterium]|nr:TlpA family protein disulfide reductase [Myxococcota bacterium]